MQQPIVLIWRIVLQTFIPIPFIPHLLLDYLILHNAHGIDGFPEFILLPRVVVEPLSQFLNRLVQFPKEEDSNEISNRMKMRSCRVLSLSTKASLLPSVLLGTAALVVVAGVVCLPDEVDALD